MSAESTVLLTTSCPTCGEIDAPLSSVVLRVCEEAETSTCVITCGTCHERFEKPADDNMTLLLVTLGVDVSVWSLEPVADRHDELGPLTFTELDAFSDLLSDEARISEGLASL